MGSSLVNFPKIAFRNGCLFPSKVHLYMKMLYGPEACIHGIIHYIKKSCIKEI